MREILAVSLGAAPEACSLVLYRYRYRYRYRHQDGKVIRESRDVPAYVYHVLSTRRYCFPVQAGYRCDSQLARTDFKAPPSDLLSSENWLVPSQIALFEPRVSGVFSVCDSLRRYLAHLS